MDEQNITVSESATQPVGETNSPVITEPVIATESTTPAVKQTAQSVGNEPFDANGLLSGLSGYGESSACTEASRRENPSGNARGRMAEDAPTPNYLSLQSPYR